ncbi:hypothetical protein NHQ30_004995 [Ciborinia camelliae]|nr:hypothetical protein NHQ30_004995 [Ciborinia camelliae]
MVSLPLVVVSFNEKLPITTFDLPAREENEADATKNQRKSEKFAVQCLMMVILLNIFLYKDVRFFVARTMGIPHCAHENATLVSSQSENDQSNFPTSLESEMSNYEHHQQSPWLLALAGAQSEKTSVSFNDITDICATFSSSSRNSPSNCAINTIASILLLSDPLLSLRSELIGFATPYLSDRRPPNHDSNPSALPDLRFPHPMKFPRAVPNHITHTIGSSIQHVGYYCTSTSTCNNPVFGISTHEDIPLLFRFLPSMLGTHAEILKFGFGNATGYDFTSNDFVTGGFDILLERTNDPILDPKQNYLQMKHEVHCLLSDALALPGLFFNINRDSEAHALLHGAISPWTRSEKSEIGRMKTIIVPEQNMITCAMATAAQSSLSTQLRIYWASIFGLIASGVSVWLFVWWWENRKGGIRL